MKAKKLLCILAAIVCLVGCLGGCKGETTKTSGKDSKKFTYWVEMPAQLASVANSMSEVTLYKELEKKTGVEIEFIHAPSGQASEKFNLLVASKNLPDMIEYNWKKYPGGPSKAIEDGIIYSLNDYVEKNAPDFWKIMQEYPNIRKDTVSVDGDYFGFPQIKLSSSNIYGGLMIRKDWLDDLGLEVPETIDEWDTALRAFKTVKGVKAPLQMEAGWFKVEGQGNNFNSAFGVDLGYYIDNGEVKLGPAEPGYKEYITLFHNWYKDGILDNEFDTLSGSAVESRIMDGYSGAFFGYIGNAMGKYLSAKELTDKKFNLAGAQHPVKNKGDEPYFMSSVKSVSAPHVAITTSCSNPELAVNWMNNFYTNEGALLAQWGVEGLTYEIMEDGLRYFTDEIQNNPDGLSVFEAKAKHTRGYSTCPGVNIFLDSQEQKDLSIDQQYTYPQQVDALRTYSKYSENRKKTQVPDLEYDPKVASELSSLEFNINTYVYETVIRFITGDEPLSNYDKYLANLKKLKLDRVLEIKQAAYDKYMAN